MREDAEIELYVIKMNRSFSINVKCMNKNINTYIIRTFQKIKNQITDYILAILGNRAPKFRRIVDYFIDFVNNLVRMRKSHLLLTLEQLEARGRMQHFAKLPWQRLSTR
jgi:hypothetical protein